MSELNGAWFGNGNQCVQLLCTVSAVALLSVGSVATAAEDDRPTVWIELGGQLERVSHNQDLFLPSFSQTLLDDGWNSPARVQRQPNYSLGFDGSVTFMPHESDWVFSAAVRYGRSNGFRRSHEQSVPTSPYAPPPLFSDGAAKNSANHTVLDFGAGRDVGLGLGAGSVSTFSAGVRYAQFGSNSSGSFRARPGDSLIYTASVGAARSFHGIGPSLSWNGSVPLAGSAGGTELSFDAGANVAVLFGRQKAEVHYQSTSNVAPPASGGAVRSRSAIVPNVGGFAGMSVKFPGAHVSLGYRADFFLNAMDTGFDTRTKSDLDFHGPFAAISIGLGG